jgi:crotonobetainyl-CoA:carnitine CoA-transferase CaiB-like acyl-CoA transferase
VAPPFAFEFAGLRRAGPRPLLGQHTREVLTEIGIDEQRLAGLVERGVVATAET